MDIGRVLPEERHRPQSELDLDDTKVVRTLEYAPRNKVLRHRQPEREEWSDMSQPKKRSRFRGPTLVEVLVVIVCMSPFVCYVPSTRRSPESEKRTATMRAIDLHDEIMAFYIEHERMPRRLTELTRFNRGIGKRPPRRRDPWGRDYAIRRGRHPEQFEVASAGPDREMGTADDISSIRR